MPSCAIPTNDGMYGFGIRLSFYIQWATIIAADYVFTPSRSVRERAAAFLMEAAVLIALAKHFAGREHHGDGGVRLLPPRVRNLAAPFPRRAMEDPVLLQYGVRSLAGEPVAELGDGPARLPNGHAGLLYRGLVRV